MKIYRKGQDDTSDRIGMTVWSRFGKKTNDGKGSITLTIEDTTMDEFIKKLVDWVDTQGNKN